MRAGVAVALALGLAVALRGTAAAQATWVPDSLRAPQGIGDPFQPPRNLRVSRISLVGPDEPGTPMVVTGRVFDAAGKRPAAGVVIGVYQTDRRGYYGATTLASTVARLRGWLRTDSLGRYEIRTIRPGSYPGGGTPEHIHFVVGDWAHELRFEDDRLAIAREVEQSRREGTFGMVRPVTRDARGVLHVLRDFRLH